MHITLLVLQRKGRYPGQYGPEVVSVVDEVTADENPDWWPDEVARHKAAIGDEADRWAEVTVAFPDDEVNALLYPEKSRRPINGKVL